MDQNGFKSKYTARQIESKLDQIGCFDCGVFKIPSSEDTPVNLDTICDDFEIDTGLYVIDHIDPNSLPVELQNSDILSHVLHIYTKDNVRYQLLISCGSMYLRHFITDSTRMTGTWSAWEKLIVGAITAESITAALGYKPADWDDVEALQQQIEKIREDLEKLRKNSENNFNAIKIAMKNSFKLNEWFINDVTILRITIVTYGQVSLNTHITINNTCSKETISVPSLIPRSTYIYDLYDKVSNLEVLIENANNTKADMIIEYMGPQDGKYGGLIKDPSTGEDLPDCPDDPDVPGGDDKPCKPGEGTILCGKASTYDPYLMNHITLPPSNAAIAFRRKV